MAAVIVLVCVLAAVGCLLLLPVRLDIQYHKDAVLDNAHVYIRFLWFKFDLTEQKKEPKKNKKKAQAKEKEQKKAWEFSDFREKFQQYTKVFSENKEDISDIFLYAREHALHVEKIDFQLNYGFADPMHTGLGMGLISGAAYNVLAFITHWLAVDMHNIDIRPNFDEACFSVKFWCIVRVKNVHIMVIAMKSLRLVRRLRRNKII